MLINIIAPIYNEQDNVKKLVTELSEFANLYPQHKFEFVLVNDGSSDDSHKRILELDDERIVYIRLSRNFGKEAAVIAGLDYAKDADAATIIDSDLQMPIRYIGQMIENYEKGVKLTICKKKSRDTKNIKGFLAQKYYSVFSRMTKSNIVEDALDFVFMDNQVINEVRQNRESNRFFKGIIATVGFEYEVLEIEIDERVSGESSYGSFSQLFSYGFVSLAAYSKIPLYFAIYLGILTALSSFIYGVVVIISYFVYGNDVPGYSTLLCVMLFLFGIILVVLGIIGYYIGLILDEVKERPLYIVDEVYKK
ncbi:glycosyltransferase [Mollicutes bacterium LVI A0078]|nr:glycosyltransferase [Mollicutes bacterium LVI A0075]WOO91498.1 glycosyltransferase [Mollicutes bacterium LVI A0078]